MGGKIDPPKKSTTQTEEPPSREPDSKIIIETQDSPIMACFVTMVPITVADPQRLMDVLNDALGADTFAVEVC